MEALDKAESLAKSKSATAGIKTNGVTGSESTAAQRARIQDTLNKCEEQKKKCESECDQAANAAGGDDNVTPALMPTPQGQDGESRGDVNSEKQNACVAPMGAAIGDLGAALAALAMAAAAMMATQDKSEDEKKENDPKTEDPKCEEATNYQKQVCTDDYIKKCTADMNAANCDKFAQMYCGNTSGTTDQPITNPGTGTDQLAGSFGPNSTAKQSTIDDSPFTQGAGSGSEFCSMVARLNATKVFCQDTGNSSCPSCNASKGGAAGFLNSTAEEMQAAQNSCPGDPIMKDPKVVSNLSTLNSTASTGIDPAMPGSGTPVTGGDGTAAGTGGGALDKGTDQSIAGPAAFGAVNEGSGMKSWDMSVSGGGGGGGGSGYNQAAVDEALRDPAGLIGKKGAVVAATLATGAKDIAEQYGPGPFSIVTGAYQSLCKNNKVNCK